MIPNLLSPKYIWHPRQNPKKAFRNAAMKINAAAIGTRALMNKPPTVPRIAKLKPTF
jgi:hypothetical protein